MNRNIYFLIIFTFLLSACGTKPSENIQNEISQFDLKGFFDKEASRLQAKNPTVTKTVSINGEAETKNLTIEEWKKELEIFSSADINKADWKGEFKKSVEGNKEIYTTNNPKILVKKLVIINGEKTKEIEVVISKQNLVYASSDTLKYIPDSLYEIKKVQKIKLLDPRKYLIRVEF
ncbi:hypothetical protein [Pedobacter flavus]|uniref:Uncharacterized protein n=1 Tax=Pedobacter flavus TaxID=3113906 RepID=A0ABU7GXY3_9SPHI|nr:hypothetical protein [Pedobacter sp. VNH31]MEE1883840.1 hypothetical protein [Pedobacter sp. VNH31]